MKIIDILEKDILSLNEIRYLLLLENKEEIELLKNKAQLILKKYCSEKVFLRGLIEFSNYCINNCLYCGIRRSNKTIKRYTLEKEEILHLAKWTADMGYGSIVLQSGERNDRKFIDFVAEVVNEIKIQTKSNKLPNGLGITLCLGEQSKEDFKLLFDAGAHRYLLRIETSNPNLFKKIHPPKQSFSNRVKALHILKEIGYQVGTGVMIGIPNQTIEDLAKDIIFFQELDVDMIGMGPFIYHSNTPMYNPKKNTKEFKNSNYQLSLKMIGIARIVLKDVNIASTTALQAIKPFGREAGLQWGANVIMPLLTPPKHRKEYQLYEGKPCLDEIASECFDCNIKRIESIDRIIAKDEWGDSKHFLNKKNK